MKKTMFGILLFATVANANEIQFFCRDTRIADGPSWSAKFDGQRLTLIPNENFPEKIQASSAPIILNRSASDASKIVPMGVYSGKNDKDEDLALTITSISLSSIELPDANFYSGNLWSDAASVKLNCSGPKLDRKF